MTPPALSTLPPLNPMATAPRDGTRVIVMNDNGNVLLARCLSGKWMGRIEGTSLDYMPVCAVDAELLGWWPMPEVRG